MDLPSDIDIPSAWKGTSFSLNRNLYRHDLSGNEISGLRTSVEQFISSGIQSRQISSSNYILLTFAQRPLELGN